MLNIELFFLNVMGIESQIPSQQPYGGLVNLVDEMKQKNPGKYAQMKQEPISIYLGPASDYSEECMKSEFSIEWGDILFCGQSSLDLSELEENVRRDCRTIGEQGIHTFVHGGRRQRPHSVRNLRRY